VTENTYANWADPLATPTFCFNTTTSWLPAGPTSTMVYWSCSNIQAQWTYMVYQIQLTPPRSLSGWVDNCHPIIIMSYFIIHTLSFTLSQIHTVYPVPFPVSYTYTPYILYCPQYPTFYFKYILYILYLPLYPTLHLVSTHNHLVLSPLLHCISYLYPPHDNLTPTFSERAFDQRVGERADGTRHVGDGDGDGGGVGAEAGADDGEGVSGHA
jgi:hypothetical protein